jgi:hypothetical protein
VSLNSHQHLDAGFIEVDHRSFQQPIEHQIQQWLEVFAALYNLARERLARDFNTVPVQHRLETVQR